MPTNTWGGAGLLGVSIRFCSFEGASENIWHILVSSPDSVSLLSLFPTIVAPHPDAARSHVFTSLHRTSSLGRPLSMLASSRMWTTLLPPTLFSMTRTICMSPASQPLLSLSLCLCLSLSLSSSILPHVAPCSRLRSPLLSTRYALIEKHNMKPLRLYVYNSETDRCREVTITPNKSWGGEGR